MEGVTPGTTVPPPMKNPDKSRPARSTIRAFSLVEIIVVVAILAVLVVLAIPTLGRMRKSAAEVKSVSVMKSVLQGCVLYSTDNMGQINTLKWESDSLERPWVAGTFWGRVAPYLFTMPRITDQKQLQTQLMTQLKTLFGTDPRNMKGTPFEGVKIYGDTAAVGLPFAFNKYMYEFYRPGQNDGWVTQLQIPRPASTVYMTYGSAFFDEDDGKAYEPMPKDGSKPVNNIFYLPSKAAVAGYLDGRVEMITAPIPPEAIRAFSGCHSSSLYPHLLGFRFSPVTL